MKLKLRLSLFCLLSNIFSSHAYDFNNLADTYLKKAEACKAENDMQEALKYYINAAHLKPNDFMLMFNIANDLYNAGNVQESITYYDRAAAIQPRVEQIYFNKGIALTQLKEHEQAAECFMQALNVNVDYEKAYLHAGNAFEQSNKHDQAIQIYQKAIEHFPNNAVFYHRLGLTYKHVDRFEEAVTYLRHATEKNPGSNTYKFELANALHLIDASFEALELYEKILESNPNNHHILYNFGYTLKKLGHYERALEVYNHILKEHPDYALAHFSRSLSYLTLGKWQEGWPEYEWRWHAYGESPKKFDAPVWQGEDVHGKRMLIYAEQGLGDTIQFVRYAQLVKELGAYVIVQTQGPLKELLKQCPYIDEVYARGEALPYFDTHIAMMSLPMVFKTEIETTPHHVPYIFAKQELIEYWADQLKDDTNFKIGICWQGNPNYRTQFLRQAVAGKSMHVKEFIPIARMRGVSIYNLQKMGGEDQLSELPNDVEIKSFGPELDTEHGRFMDTVAIMKNLDLIITIDTGTCHVAAALGVPTWNLLPNPADWRWMIDTDETPWYTNMRLFKQPTPGDWSGAIQEVIHALVPILEGKITVAEATADKGNKKERRPYQTMQKNNYAKPTIELKHHKQSHDVRIEDIDTITFEPIGNQTTPIQYKQIKRGGQQHAAVTIQQEHKLMMDEVYKRHPEIKDFIEKKDSKRDLTAQLIAINKQLWELDAELKQMQPSVFDESYIAIAEKIVHAIQRKKYIKSHINKVVQQKSMHA